MAKGDKHMITSTLRDKSLNFLHLEAQETFRRLIESLKTGVYIADKEGNLVYVNQAFADILGYESKDEVIGLNLAKQLYPNPKDRETFLKTMDEKGYVKDYEVKNIRKDKSIVTLSATSNFIRNEHNEIIGVEGVVIDITQKKRLEKVLLAEKQKLEQILGFDEKVAAIRKFDALIDFIVEKIAQILEAQKCSLMLFDEEKGELCIQGAKGLSEDLIKAVRLKLGEGIAGSAAQKGEPVLVNNIEYSEEFKRANRLHYLGRSFMVVPIKVNDRLLGVICVADKYTGSNHEEVFNEIDLRILCALSKEVAVALENVKLYKELNYLAITDPLTQLYNYRYFIKSLEYEIKRAERFDSQISLALIDIDDFKKYNDTFGHLEGDHLLKELARIFNAHLRETDIVCRYAGDEFAIIFPQSDKEGTSQVTDKLRKAVEEAVFKNKVTISIGVACYVAGMDRHDCILKADMALYEAKRGGKNKVVIRE